MKKIIYTSLLLLFCLGLSAQYEITDGDANILFLNGLPIKGPAAVVYPDPAPDTFEGTIFKEVTFAELPPDENTNARARIFMGSSDIDRWDLDSAYADSTVIIVNDNGDLDSVWQVRLTTMPLGSPESGGGSTWVGQMQLNGINTAADTLTWYNLTEYIWFGPDWDWVESRGGKLPGISGSGHDGYPGPGGGVHDCGCPEPFPSGYDPYCPDDGFRIRGGFDYNNPTSSYDDVGVYAYIWQLESSLDCVGKTYGYTWNRGRLTGTQLDWELEKWYKINYRVNTGTAGNSDGYIQFSRNDTVIWSVENIKIRGNSNVKADTWMLANFPGGDPTDNFLGMWIRHDDFKLWQEENTGPYSVGEVMTNVPSMATPNAN